MITTKISFKGYNIIMLYIIMDSKLQYLRIPPPALDWSIIQDVRVVRS